VKYEKVFIIQRRICIVIIARVAEILEFMAPALIFKNSSCMGTRRRRGGKDIVWLGDKLARLIRSSVKSF